MLEVTELLWGTVEQGLKSGSVYPKILLGGTMAGYLRLQAPSKSTHTKEVALNLQAFPSVAV